MTYFIVITRAYWEGKNGIRSCRYTLLKLDSSHRNAIWNLILAMNSSVVSRACLKRCIPKKETCLPITIFQVLAVSFGEGEGIPKNFQFRCFLNPVRSGVFDTPLSALSSIKHFQVYRYIPWHPCMAYEPAFSCFLMTNVSEYIHIYIYIYIHIYHT